jgi:hypothetical protein
VATERRIFGYLRNAPNADRLVITPVRVAGYSGEGFPRSPITILRSGGRFEFSLPLYDEVKTLYQVDIYDGNRVDTVYCAVPGMPAVAEPLPLALDTLGLGQFFNSKPNQSGLLAGVSGQVVGQSYIFDPINLLANQRVALTNPIVANAMWQTIEITITPEPLNPISTVRLRVYLDSATAIADEARPPGNPRPPGCARDDSTNGGVFYINAPLSADAIIVYEEKSGYNIGIAATVSYWP